MHLTYQEKEKLLLYLAGKLAKERLKKGIKLNYPESIAIISNYITEKAREGEKIDIIIKNSKKILTYNQVMDGIPEMIKYIQIEATFPDGTKLVSVSNPIKNNKSKIIPGEYNLMKKDILLNKNKKKMKIPIINIGNRTIQIGSHFPFSKCNSSLKFERKKTKNYHLNLPAGISIRIKPGEKKEIELVKIGGNKN